MKAYSYNLNMLTATYKCQQHKCYPRKHLNSGKRDEKNEKWIENKNVNRMLKKCGGGGVIPSHDGL
jgi:hypothetical protein